MTTKAPALLLAAALAAAGAKAETLDATDVRAAAVAFVNRDEIGASVLAGRQVASVTARDALWVVRLSPSGYIVFSGDTAAEPVVAFSTNDYVEPPDDSPFGAMLSIANENALKSGAKSAVANASPANLLKSASVASVASLASSASSATSTVADRRAAKWSELLGTSASSASAVNSTANASSFKMASLLRTASLGDSLTTETVEVKPFLTTTWNQCQPYNDYAPVYSPEGDGYDYRGRCPCGCVATAYAQILKYWEWPKRLEDPVSFTHSVFNSTEEMILSQLFSVRLDGRVPFDWRGMLDKYEEPSGATSYDWRGFLAESNRYAVARLVLYADALAEMWFASDMSGASTSTLANANPWYENGVYLQRYGSNYEGTYVSDEAELQSRICAEIRKGVPVPVSVTLDEGGHSIVAHGWKSGSDGTEYMYFNYGWGGYWDGYFTMSASEDGTGTALVRGAIVGLVPRCTAQIDPLPAVVDPDSSIDLKWAVPERLASEITGFTLNWKELGTEAKSVLQDFSNASWISTDSSDRICVTTSSSLDNDTEFLQVTQLASGSVTLFDEEVVLTSCSELSYRVRYDHAIGLTVRFQMSSDGAEWDTIETIPIWDAYSELGWKTRKVFLGERGGESVRLRLLAETSGSYFPSYPSDWTCGVQIDDVQVSDVLSSETRLTKSLDADARTFSVSKATTGVDFNPGALAFFALTPTTSADSSVLCDTIQTRIAGEAKILQPGVASFVTNDVAYSAGAENWTVQTGSSTLPSGSQVVLGPYSGSLSLQVEDALTEKSVLSFGWTANNWFDGSNYDEIAVRWIDDDASVTTLFVMTNTASQAAVQTVSVSLAAVAGRRGDLAIAVSHTSYVLGGDNIGLCVQDAKVTDVVSLVKPTEIAWATQTFAASTLPSITDVTSISETSPAVQDGFYRECARGTNVFFVSCSENVTSLAARPSHLSLVPDSAVAVYPQGGGKFVVTVDGSGIDDEHDRSRLILTLVASDANGTTTAKDLSLRFSSATTSEAYEPPVEEKTTSTTPIPVPHAWLVEKGVVAEGATDADFEAAAALDQDGDGQPTYAEYLCGTDPTNKDDVFKIFIEMVDGDPVISWTPTNAAASYFVQGVTNLVDETWVDTNAVNRAGLRFFRVRVEPR